MKTKTATPSDAARALRAIKSEKRSEQSRINGRKGGRPKTECYERDRSAGQAKLKQKG